MLLKILEFKNTNLIIIIVSIICFVSSICTSFVFGQDPCLLCLITRFGFLTTALLSLIAFSNKKWAIYFPFLSSCLLLIMCFYHLGVENHWWASPETCKVPLPTLESLINPEKLGATKSCDEIVLTIFGISMTLLSFLISAFLFWISSLSIVLRLSYKQTEL